MNQNRIWENLTDLLGLVSEDICAETAKRKHEYFIVLCQ